MRAHRTKAGSLRWRRLLAGLAASLGTLPAPGQAPAPAPLPAAGQARPGWADWIERDFPFFSAMVYAQRPAPAILAGNITPRGIVLNLGANRWVCFDLDLLRVAAVWEGEEVKTQSNAAVSYHGAWPPIRERAARQPLAETAVWFANGLYPGWQIGTEPSLRDPRPPGPPPDLVPRGPLAEPAGRFRAVRFTPDGVRLEYRVGDATIGETLTRVEPPGAAGVERRIRVSATQQPLVLVLAARDRETRPASSVVLEGAEARSAELLEHPDVWAVRVPPHAEPVEFRVRLLREARAGGPSVPAAAHESPARRPRWPHELVTRATLSREQGAAHVVDDIPLPLDNPWRRNVRLADLQFFPDGTAAALTFDGDVWLVRGLQGELGAVRWRRFTSGLHEPLSMAIRDEELFVFDRNGLWRLRDTDGDGEADIHEMFTNAFGQTLTLNEYSNTLKLAPDGSFIIAKKGLHDPARGEMHGTVLRVSPDGATGTVLGWGFRQPFVGVDPVTGLVTASDQEGNYVPATPLYVVRGGTYHGFLAAPAPKEQYPAPIADPLVWIPRLASASGVTQVWLRNARMGPLNDALLYVSYNPAALFVVRLNERHARPQAAVVALSRQFDFSPIGATVNPVDGQLYVAGFKIYGSSAARTSGLARVRYTGRASTLPREVVPMKEGVLLRFDVEVAAEAARDLANYSVERWNYRRTAAYGSPHYKLDGSKGQERMPPSSAYLSQDRRSVFLGVPDMRAGVMQMQISWRLAAADGSRIDHTAHCTPWELAAFDPAQEGFGALTVNLVPRAPAETAPPRVASAAEGRRLSHSLGCVACHLENGAAQLGPSWRGLFGRRRELTDGSVAMADEAYLRESILDPAAKVVPGFEAPMPSYAGILGDTEVESLVLHIRTLQAAADR